VRWRGLEDLDGGVVGGEQALGPAIAVEVGDERRREAVGVVLDRVPVVREVVPRLPEREIALVLAVEGMVCLGFRSILVGKERRGWRSGSPGGRRRRRRRRGGGCPGPASSSFTAAIDSGDLDRISGGEREAVY
jgi:hypothetical protein